MTSCLLKPVVMQKSCGVGKMVRNCRKGGWACQRLDHSASVALVMRLRASGFDRSADVSCNDSRAVSRRGVKRFWKYVL